MLQSAHRFVLPIHGSVTTQGLVFDAFVAVALLLLPAERGAQRPQFFPYPFEQYQERPSLPTRAVWIGVVLALESHTLLLQRL